MPSGQHIFSRAHATEDILSQSYDGSGTATDPFRVKWMANDPTDPLSFSNTKKWVITFLLSLSTLSVALASSAYTGAVPQLMDEYGVSAPTAYLGVSLFVLCFAIGPLIWASLCEIVGRQTVFVTTFAAFTAFNIGTACSKNIQSILVCRFFAGAFGSSSLVNTGGVLADIFSPKERGAAMSIFTASLFFGPTLGPITGSFIGQTQSWRWIEGFIAIMSGVLWAVGSLMIPETYSPVLLQRRAQTLSRITDKAYQSMGKETQKSRSTIVKAALIRPWCLLFFEPVVILVSTYLAIVYGILYLLFAAFPVVYSQERGWEASIASLPFLAVLFGMSFGVGYCMLQDRKIPACAFSRTGHANDTTSRLQPATVGAISIPIGLFMFAWTNGKHIHFVVSCIGSALFGFGLVNIFISMTNYLVDTYSVFAASSLAASSVIRSVLGAVFPLFTPTMYQTLGIHWASSIPAFISLACVPVPFLLWQYHPWLGSRSRYIIKARVATENLRG